MRRPLLALLTASALAGCAVGPDFKPPAAPVSDRYAPDRTLAAVAQPVAAQTVAAEWWHAFGSPELNAIVAEALRSNPDLKSADAALRQARAQYRAARANLLPTADASIQSQRARTSEAISPVLTDNADLYTLHTAELDISYVLDVFGGVRRGVEASRAQAENQAFQYEAARTTLIANVISGAVQEASLRIQVQAARDAAASGREVLAFTRRQAELGALGQADVAAAETTLGQAEQAVIPLEKALAAQQSALAILVGREPGQGAPTLSSLDALQRPSTIPAALPSQLVRQRPDIRAAEANLHAASANVGVAIAARLPILTLTASGGGQSPAFQHLTDPSMQFWSLAANAAQPIFRGGALFQQQKAAEAGLDQAKAQYRSTVLTALKNVADTLDALERDNAALKVAATTDVAARKSRDFARRQLELGQVGALSERAAEQAAAQAQGAEIAAWTAHYLDIVALYQALGGGWSGKVEP